MSEKFVIQGGKPLNGEVEIEGYKNSAGPALAASLLTNEDVIIDNLPLVEDVFVILDILKDMGAKIERLDTKKIKINTRDVKPENLDFEKFAKTRLSVVLIGPLLARFGELKVPRPGGDKIGLRPITTHLEALKKLGAKIEEKGEFYIFQGKNLFPTEIVLKEFSVTATENVMLAASLLNGETTIKGAACEPQVQDLGEMLKKMGVEIDGLGGHTITIRGKKNLKGVEHTIIPDPIATVTYIIAGSVTPGKVNIKNIRLDHLDLFLDKLEEIGVNFKRGKDSIIVDYSPNLNPARVQTFFYPGFPTDFLPFTSILLTQAKGKSLVHDPLYESRFNYLQELRKMGADIEIVDPHRAIIFGKTPLAGLSIESWDIRAGASLVVAALLAEGETTINNIYQIDRGYEKFEKKLQALGADIKRVKA
jgi:UDP-N-acetylglucosamine 1-carboxyvinyltransferase